MKTKDQWFSEYSESHKNTTNKKIHWICVPLIFFSVLGLLWSLPWIEVFDLRLPWTAVLVLLGTIFYSTLDYRWALIMLAVSAMCCTLFLFLEHLGVALLPFNAAIFIFAWVGQAYGHKVEGKKPSFFTDVVFLFIGPLWVIKGFLETDF